MILSPFMVNIRPAAESDHDAVWRILHTIIARGDTFTLDPGAPRADALRDWFSADHHVFVAQKDGNIAGTYILRPNQRGGGAHVANAAFAVAPEARGGGIGRAMATHCLEEARLLGFRAMQFNFVISTNQDALHLWRSLGFEIVGTLPGAFHHPERGDVDVYVMFRSLL